MDKKTIAWLKTTFPGVFNIVVKSPFITRLILEFDRCRYIQCRMLNKPYFGTICLAGQTWEERKPWMIKLIVEESKRRQGNHFSLLEVGSWAGNSAVLWAEAIKANNSQATVLCIDAWEPYMDVKDFDQTNVATQLMNEDLAKGKIFKLFLHNIKAAGHADIIFPFKGSSNQLLPRLEKESFEIIYLDGDHRYQQFTQNLLNASRILKLGGVICGDDLDLTIEQIDQAYAIKNREVNVIVDPLTQQVFHPGITLACHDFFKMPITSYHGFWALRKTLTGWEQVVL